MTVLHEIFEWSTDRPNWQRDALRRLVLNGELSEKDINDLAEICKSSQGLTEQQVFVPLTRQDLPDNAIGSAPVSLVSIFHQQGVNALAEQQTLNFARTLTLVYGDNAAGKTGYIRILKSACRARGQEKVLGNVTSGTTPLAPAITIKYKVNAESEPREWAGNGEDDFISRVSVFDTQSANIYLTEKTDVAFRPFGLDLFDKLVKACKSIRAKLESEQRALVAKTLPTVPEGTAVAKLLSNINSLTKPETVKTLSHLLPEEEAQLAILEKSLLDLTANDPDKLIRQLTLLAGRVQTLTRHLKEMETTLSEEAVANVFDERAKGRLKSEQARKLRDITFQTAILKGTGSDPWKTLWEAARQFSQDQAYPNQQFPVVGSDTYCVLCQQDLDNTAGHRLEQFEAFVASTTEQELLKIRESFSRLRKKFTEFRTTTEAIDTTIKEIRIENEAVADAINAAFLKNEIRRQAIIHALTEDKDLAADCPDFVSVVRETDEIAAQIDARINALRSNTTEETRKSIAIELQELRARKMLAAHEQIVLDEIERKRKYAAYGLCLDEVNTQSITKKSTAITKTTVSQLLKESFKDELKTLGFSHVEVELKEAGGEDGVLYHKLILTRSPGVELPKVVSEGEQRCLSIAAFFAELSTADDPSGIVFDDPVSSLDYKWRESVARRLVQEAKIRQVIVFTHDIVFLLLLKQFAKELNVEQLDQHVQQLPKGAGVCIEELPWVALPVKKKIKFLKNECQSAEKLFRDGYQTLYEKEAKHLYGLLREAWERAVEEVLLSGIVERFRPGVQTQQINQISDITTEDCKILESSMTKCSKWLTGHDQAAAARAPIPEPTQLQEDIEKLEGWVKTIRKRRDKGANA